MNLLDSAIATLSPSHAAKRAAAQLALEQTNALIQKVKHQTRSYDGASRNPAGGFWHAVNTSGSTEIARAGGILRARSSDMVRNNPLAARAIQVITSETIGTGITLRAKSPDDKLNATVNALWAAFKLECDADTGLDFDALQAVAMRCIVERGECLVRFRARKTTDGFTVPLQLQLLEPDFIDDSAFYKNADQNYVLNGIQFDALGQRMGYHLFKQHPGETYAMGSGLLGGVQSNFVPASSVAHIYRVDRAGQVRGASWLAPVLIALRDLHDYKTTMQVKKKIEACFAAFRTKNNSEQTFAPADGGGVGLGEGGDGDTETGLPSETLEPGMIYQLKNGEDVKFAQPTSTAGEDIFIRGYNHDIAAGLGITYQDLTGDLSQANYSNMRAGKMAFRRNVDQWRWGMLVPMLLRPVWAKFIEAAKLAGHIPANADVPVEIVPPRYEWVDPQADIQATILSVRAGLSTPSEAVMAMGEEPTAHWQKYAQDLKTLDALGLSLSIDARQPYSSDAFVSSGKDANSGTGGDVNPTQKTQK